MSNSISMKSSANFSSDRVYRYALYRVWDDSLPLVMFIGLNPSVANETENDRTINKCIGYAQKWGCGGLIMANIFAYCSTDRSKLKTVKNPVGDENNEWLLKLSKKAKFIVAAWGTDGALFDRAEEVKKMNLELYCLEISIDGHPKHPLYLKSDLKPKPFHLTKKSWPNE